MGDGKTHVSKLPGQELSDWCLGLLRIGDKGRLAAEIATQLPSPGEVDLMAVPVCAKALRRTLLRDVECAPGIEAAREVVFDFAASLIGA